MRSHNPVFNEKWDKQTPDDRFGSGEMTLRGAVSKILILTLLLLACAAATWVRYEQGVDVTGMVIASTIIAFILAILTLFKPKFAFITAPAYAALEGIALGGVSALFETQYDGIILNAILLTVTTLIVMLLLYLTRTIKVTPRFRVVMLIAMLAIVVTYLINLGLRLFGIELPFLYDAGPIGIGISLVIVCVAALSLLLDFDFIEQHAKNSAPKYMEWYAAFGLMVTLVWLYLEILQLLSKIKKS